MVKIEYWEKRFTNKWKFIFNLGLETSLFFRFSWLFVPVMVRAKAISLSIKSWGWIAIWRPLCINCLFLSSSSGTKVVTGRISFVSAVTWKNIIASSNRNEKFFGYSLSMKEQFLEVFDFLCQEQLHLNFYNTYFWIIHIF